MRGSIEFAVNDATLLEDKKIQCILIYTVMLSHVNNWSLLHAPVARVNIRKQPTVKLGLLPIYTEVGLKKIKGGVGGGGGGGGSTLQNQIDLYP